MSGMDLSEFLLARIGEDEADAVELSRQHDRWRRERDRNGADGSQGSVVASLIAPARVLAECEAKRRIVEDARFDDSQRPSTAPTRLFRLLALPYADHPDYRQEWKP